MAPEEHLDSHTFLFDGPDDWVLYPTAYWDAAELILDEARANSFLLHPGLFLVRHYVELFLKDLLSRADMTVPTHHNLLDLWRRARTVPNISQNSYATPDVLDPVGEYIEDVARLDASSFTFRYPVDKDGNAHGLEGQYSARNVLTWARGLKDAFITLEGAIDMGLVHREFDSEMRADYGP